MLRSLRILALPLALTVTAIPALADTALFRFEDLDLSGLAGLAQLDARLEATVRRACPAAKATGTRMVETAAHRVCMDDARKQIVDHLAARGITNRQAG